MTYKGIEYSVIKVDGGYQGNLNHAQYGGNGFLLVTCPLKGDVIREIKDRIIVELGAVKAA